MSFANNERLFFNSVQIKIEESIFQSLYEHLNYINSIITLSILLDLIRYQTHHTRHHPNGSILHSQNFLCQI